MGSSSKAYKGELGQLDVQNKNTKHYFNSVIMKTLSLSFSIFLALSIFLYLHTLANFGLCLIFIFFSYIGERCIIDFFDVYLKAIGEGSYYRRPLPPTADPLFKSKRRHKYTESNC